MISDIIFNSQPSYRSVVMINRASNFNNTKHLHPTTERRVDDETFGGYLPQLRITCTNVRASYQAAAYDSLPRSELYVSGMIAHNLYI